jgi:hypothetical protein
VVQGMGGFVNGNLGRHDLRPLLAPICDGGVGNAEPRRDRCMVLGGMLWVLETDAS